MNPKPPVLDDINFWPFSEILVIFAITAIMNLKVIPGWNGCGFFFVILHILKNICAKFQLVIIFGWVSVRINRTIISVEIALPSLTSSSKLLMEQLHSFY